MLPLQEHNFCLHKNTFHDTVALRYGWNLARLRLHCACGTLFSVEHSFTCPKGGFPSICLNEIRNLTASLLTEVCHEVEVEPHLQPVTSEQFNLASSNTEDGTHLDTSANGFWGGRCEKTYVVLIPMLLAIDPPMSRVVTGNMNKPKKGLMNLGFVKLNTVLLFF